MSVSLEQLHSLFSDRRIFPRRRVDPRAKAIAVKAYTRGLSLSQVEELLEEMGYKVSREAIRRWFLKAGELLSLLWKGLGRRASWQSMKPFYSTLLRSLSVGCKRGQERQDISPEGHQGRGMMNVWPSLRS